MKTIINLTQHNATPEQIKGGVMDAMPTDKALLSELLTFRGIPTMGDVHDRAVMLAALAVRYGAESAMIGGVGYLMGPLETALIEQGIVPCYAVSDRVSVETVQPDGSVLKTNVFRHLGLLEVCKL